MDSIEIGIQFHIATKFDPLSVAKLSSAFVDMIQERLPPTKQFHGLIQRFATVVKNTAGDRLL